MAALTHIALHVEDLDACVAFYQAYAGLKVVHERSSGSMRVVWLTAGANSDFVLVMLSGGRYLAQAQQDFSHLGLALNSREEVEQIADKAAIEHCLVWPVVEEPWPTGYYCGVRDPNGHIVEFSFGQPYGYSIQQSTA